MITGYSSTYGFSVGCPNPTLSSKGEPAYHTQINSGPRKFIIRNMDHTSGLAIVIRLRTICAPQVISLSIADSSILFVAYSCFQGCTPYPRIDSSMAAARGPGIALAAAHMEPLLTIQ